ncbi:MAG: hypothetical protein LJE67_08315 [Salaquimonas sp.]|jgi:hypothetical protein|nr:hypothetical protein [Salaquimonas sp.]
MVPAILAFAGVLASGSPAWADLVNQAVAAGLFNGGEVTSPEGAVSVPFAPVRRALEVAVLSVDFDTKAAGGDEVGPGDTLTYTIRVTNQGNVTLSGVAPKLDSLSFAGQQQQDAMPAEESEATVTLAPGETRDFKLVYTLSADNVYSAAGVENGVASLWSANAEGGAIEVAQAERRDTIAATPALEITSSFTFAEDGGTEGSADVGDLIVYRYVVHNTGNVALSDIHIVDHHGTGQAYEQTFDSSTYTGPLGNGAGQWNLTETTPAVFGANEDVKGDDAVFDTLGVGGIVTFIYTHQVTQEEFDAQ